MRKRRSINRKITTLFLAALLGAMLLTGGVSIWSLISMRGASAEANALLGRTAAEDAEKALEDMAGEHLQDIAVEKAAYIGEKFDIVKAYVHGIANLAEEIYANPEEFPDRSVALPQADSSVLAAQLLWSKRLAWLMESSEAAVKPEEPAVSTESAALMTEMHKLGNIQDLLVQYNANSHMVSSSYVATRSGWMIQADYIAFSKYTNGAGMPDYYEAEERQWYQRSLLAQPGEIVYSEVIKDVHTGGDCIVCARPVYRNGEIVAVAGVGSYLDTVHEAVLDTAIGESGYAFLINEEGRIMVSGAGQGETGAETGRSADLRESANGPLAKAAEEMVSGGSGLEKLTVDGREVYLAYAPLEGLGWSFAVVMDVEEVVAPAKEGQQEILVLTDAVSREQEAAIHRMLVSFFAVMLLAAVLVGIISVLFSRRLTDPICRLTAEAERIDGGNLDMRIHIATGDEVEDLGNAFNKMTEQLQSYIDNLASATAEKERIRTELGLASGIQADMLPDSSCISALRTEFAIHAEMTPAKEVGGDFYNFFLTDRGELVFLTADVSGKGVPASLFMVVAMTLLRSHINGADNLADAVAEVNNSLCANNENGMFVTVWVGVLSLGDGKLTYVNAGHNPPLLKQAGSYKYMKERSGFVLAGMEDMQYTPKSVRLHPGDAIFLYTDGVTEANNEAGKLYGESRLEELVNRHLEKEPRQLIGEIWEDIRMFQGKAEQFDDITMLAVRYDGDGCKTRTGMPDVAQIGEVSEWAEAYLVENEVPHRAIQRIRMTIDEIYSNICYYSGAREVTVGCKVMQDAENKEVFIYFEDDGIPYNPLEREDPDVTRPLEDREEGGLGIYMVKKRMDRVQYVYQEGRNRLTASLRI